MNKLVSFFKIDLKLMKPYYKSILIIFGIGLFMSILLKSPATLSSFFMVMLIIFISYPFAIGEKNNINLLYGTLPINRKTVVIGRYLLVIVYALIGALLSFLSSWVLTILLKQEFLFSEVCLFTSLLFGISMITVSLQYPIFFKLGYTKAKFATFIPLMLVFSLFLLIPTISNLFNFNLSVESMFASFMNYPLAIVLGSFLGGMALLALSCYIAYKLYSKNDI